VRIQFTSDLLTADILGVSSFDANHNSFQFHPGPIFNQRVLADEINRTTPKTQSALLEAMEERQVTAQGEQSFLADARFSWMQFRQTLWLTEIPLMVSAVSYYWDTWVVGYNTDSQFGLMTELLSGLGWSGELKSVQLGWIMLVVFFFGVVLIGAVHAATTKQQKGRVLDRVYAIFVSCLLNAVIRVHPGRHHWPVRIELLSPNPRGRCLPTRLRGSAPTLRMTLNRSRVM
tara:strand:+ start:3656 stop:4348 length:693 start_codon:yes stop_codon:yes gene_type:complete